MLTDVSIRDWSRLMNDLPRAPDACLKSARFEELPACLEGTRTGVLEAIEDWETNSESRVFWLNGLAGTGKTTIARTFADRNTDENKLVAAFFFSRGDTSLSDHALVLSTLTLQLARIHPAIRRALVTTLREGGDWRSLPLSTQYERLIIGPLKALETARHAKLSILLILDALDECKSEKGASDILRLILSDKSEYSGGLRIFVTSRPEVNIRPQFNNSRGHAEIALHDIEDMIVQSDIRLYLRTKLSKVFAEFGQDMPDDRTVERLSALAGNLFIFAATAVRFIGNVRVRNPQRQLDIVLGGRLAPGERPYSSLDSLYWKVLDNAVPKDDESFVMLRERFLLVVGAIIILRDPLCVSALALMVDREGNEIEATLEFLHSVVIVPPPDAPNEALQVFHKSFVDFLTDKKRCVDPNDKSYATDERFFIDTPDHEAFLACQCLEIMVNSLKANMAALEDPIAKNSSVDGFEESVENALSVPLRYACLYWVSHLVATELRNEKIEALVHDFLLHHLLHWIEAMSLQRSVPTAINMMREAHTWAVRSGLSS